MQNSQGSSLAAEGGAEYSESVPHARKVARAVLALPENPTRLAYRFPSPIPPNLSSSDFKNTMFLSLRHLLLLMGRTLGTLGSKEEAYLTERISKFSLARERQSWSC